VSANGGPNAGEGSPWYRRRVILVLEKGFAGVMERSEHEGEGDQRRERNKKQERKKKNQK